MTVYIYAASANTWLVDQQAPDLKDTVKTLWGKSYRRISHFIQLAMVGAKRCADQAPIAIDAQCSLLFTTGQGNISQVVKVTQQIFKEHEPPMPFDFMHITNNMAPFYVAQALGITSSNLSVAHRAFPVETAVDLATFHLQTPDAHCLIGAVDECAFPLHEHRQRLALEAETPLAEGSHWLLLGNNPQHAIAQVDFCVFFNSKEELLQRIIKHKIDVPLHLSCGYGIDGEEQQWWQNQINNVHHYDYRSHTAFHDTAAAYGIASFIERHNKQSLIHINKSRQQRYCALGVSVL